MVGFGFISDIYWVKKWRERFKPIAWHSNAKPKQVSITFDAQVKSALALKEPRQACVS